MINVKMAGITVRIHNKYAYLDNMCTDYKVSDEACVDLEVSASDAEIDKELEDAYLDGVSRGYAESICIYRKICRELPKRFDAFLFHSAVIEYEGRGYAFAARSGTGKSTHIELWKKRFGESVRVINGDKPIVRFFDGVPFACGTPWCGKEGLNINDSVPLKAICFIERAEQNSIRPIGVDESVTRIFSQILTPSDIETVDSLFPLLERTLEGVPCYLLSCNISEDAAEIAYNAMKGN